MWELATRNPAPEKPIVWCSSSLEDIRRFSDPARRAVGRQLRRLQQGKEPTDWKPISGVGRGVIELRAHVSGEQRVVVEFRYAEAVYVLHASEKKSRRMPRRDLDLVQRRYQSLMAERERP